jgi:hypothetical protein
LCRYAVVAVLPHSAVARLARSHPSVYTRLAVGLARRLRPSLPARAWDRCGAEWTSLGAGASLAAAVGLYTLTHSLKAPGLNP